MYEIKPLHTFFQYHRFLLFPVSACWWPQVASYVGKLFLLPFRVRAVSDVYMIIPQSSSDSRLNPLIFNQNQHHHYIGPCFVILWFIYLLFDSLLIYNIKPASSSPRLLFCDIANRSYLYNYDYYMKLCNHNKQCDLR